LKTLENARKEEKEDGLLSSKKVARVAAEEKVGISNIDFLRDRSAIEDSIKQVQQIAIFRDSGCTEEFLTFLSQHLEERIYIAGQTIIEEGAEDACMYILAQGSVSVKVKNHEIAQLTSGATFGEKTFFGISHKRTSTVIASVMCLVSLLHPGIVMRGLELFPDERRNVLSMIQIVQGQPADPNLMAGSQDMFVRVLKKSVLRDTSDEFLDEISVVAIDRMYAPGDFIVIEGHKSASMFVMGSGRAGVYQRNPQSVNDNGKGRMPIGGIEDLKKFRVGTINAGEVCGELAMLGILEYRLATIEAETICTMWELTEDDCMRTIERYPEARRHFSNTICHHLGHTVLLRVTQIALFSQFENAVRTYIGLYSLPRVFFPGQKVTREGKPGSNLYIINIGSATLESKGVVVKTYMSGSHFGATVMLGLDKCYVGTLVAYQTCHMICVPRGVFTQVLEQYPSVKAKEAMKQSELLAKQVLATSSKRVCTRKRVWKRYQQYISAALANKDSDPQAELLKAVLTKWREFTHDRRQQRERLDEERRNCDKNITEWVEKRQAAQERVRQRRALEQASPAPREPFSRALPPPPPSLPSPPRAAAAAASGGSPRTAGAASPPVKAEESCGHYREFRQAQIDALMKGWPAPKPSPHYELRLWRVLAETLDSPATTEPLLPLLAPDRRGGADMPLSARVKRGGQPEAQPLDAYRGVGGPLMPGSARGGPPKGASRSGQERRVPYAADADLT
jgi:CRP-like cAMP-binding protein